MNTYYMQAVLLNKNLHAGCSLLLLDLETDFLTQMIFFSLLLPSPSCHQQVWSLCCDHGKYFSP